MSIIPKAIMELYICDFVKKVLSNFSKKRSYMTNKQYGLSFTPLQQLCHNVIKHALKYHLTYLLTVATFNYYDLPEKCHIRNISDYSENLFLFFKPWFEHNLSIIECHIPFK